MERHNLISTEQSSATSTMRPAVGLSRAVGHKVVDLLGQLLDMYAVMSNDGVVITIGHRFKRINRH